MNSVFGLIHDICSWTPIDQMFGQNRMLWLHILSGGLLGFGLRKLGHSSRWNILAMFGLTIVWELVEYFVETPSRAEIVQIYGSTDRFFYDAGGDIIGALVAFILSFI